jgi:hypothetical protein
MSLVAVESSIVEYATALIASRPVVNAAHVSETRWTSQVRRGGGEPTCHSFRATYDRTATLPDALRLYHIIIRIHEIEINLILCIEYSITLVMPPKERKPTTNLKPTKLLIISMRPHYRGLTIHLRTTLTKRVPNDISSLHSRCRKRDYDSHSHRTPRGSVSPKVIPLTKISIPLALQRI